MTHRSPGRRRPVDRHPPPAGKPLRHITGKRDHVVGYHDAWSRIEHYPRATFATLDGASHTIHLEQPEVCAALVNDWLTRMRHPA